MAAPQLLGALFRLESLHRVLPDRLEHRVTALVALEQASVDQPFHLVRRRPANRLGVVGRAAAGEDRERREEPALLVVEQVVAPLDRRAQRLVACRPVPRAFREDGEPLSQSFGELCGRELANACRGELESERKAVDGDADLGDGPRVVRLEAKAVAHRLRARHEERDGLVLGERVKTAGVLPGRQPERRHAVLVLAGQPEDRPARDQHA